MDTLPDELFDKFFDDDEQDLDSDDELAIGDIDESDCETSRTRRPVDHRPIQHAHTESYKANLAKTGRRPLDAVLAVFEALKSNGLTLPWFIGLVLYGEEECTADPQVRYERTGLLGSVEFREGMLRCARPPGGKAKRGREVVEEIATEIVGRRVVEDMSAISDLMTAGEDALSRQALTALDMKKICAELKERAATLWAILRRAGWSDSQAERNTHKTPENVSSFPLPSYSAVSHTNSQPISRLL